MFTLIGATVMEAGALPMGDSLIASCGACPTRFTASGLFAVTRHSVDGPAICAPITLRSTFCSDSVAFTTETIRYLRSGLSAAYRSEEHTSELQSLRHLVC